MNEHQAAYGTTRKSHGVSYAEIQTAALRLLAQGERPSIALVRKELGTGSATTINRDLRLFWKELASQAQGTSAVLSQLPAEIRVLTEAVWQRSLELAAQSSAIEHNKASENLEDTKRDSEIQRQVSLRRQAELESVLRDKDEQLVEARQQIASLLDRLSDQVETSEQHKELLTLLERDHARLRRQLASLVKRASTMSRTVTNSTSTRRASKKAKRSPTRRKKFADRAKRRRR